MAAREILETPAGASKLAENQTARSARMRHLLLVLGVHRSGTSALTGVLSELGVALGDALLPPSEANPKGFFENREVVYAQEGLLAELGSAWHDPRPLPADWLSRPAAAAARGTLASLVAALLAASDVAAIKDPRSSRLLPLWADVAADVGVGAAAVVMVRHPDEVAASLHRRDGMSTLRGHLLWIRYLLEAERGSRGLPRVFVAYEDLLSDWRGQIARISQALGVPLSPPAESAAESVDRFLDASLRNHDAGGRRAPLASPAAKLALVLYEVLMRCVSDPAADLSADFDAIAGELDSLEIGYFDAVADSLAVEVPTRVEAELERLGVDQARAEAMAQLVALRELWRPAALQVAAGECKLYYRSELGGFHEGFSVLATPEHVQGELRARFVLPAGCAMDYVRIDPDHVPGAYSVLGLSIDGEEVADLAARLRSVNEVALPAGGAGEVVRFASSGDDPYFELDVRGTIGATGRAGAVVVELRFRRETVASEIGVQTRREQHELRSLLETLQSRLESVAVHSEVLQGRLESAAADVAELRATQMEIDSATRALLEADRLGERQRLALLEASRVRHESVIAELAVVRAQQERLLAWAERRSPRYWWRRLRLGALWRAKPWSTAGLPVLPLDNVQRIDTPGGCRAWQAETHDPQFLIGGASFSLPGGWYLLEAQVQVLDGQIITPCLYPDYGRGVSESERLFLPEPDRDGRVRGLVRFKEPIVSLRFDPSVRAARFTLDGVRLRGLGRLGAFAEIARRLTASQGSWRDALDELRPALQAATAGRVREAGDLAYARYVEDVRGSCIDYPSWAAKFDTLSEADVARLRVAAESLPVRPLLSVVMPVYQTPEKWLRRCIDSVLDQAYGHWELCIADDASPSPHVRRVLTEYMRRDPRIKVAFRAENGHISAASNSALELAAGEFIVLLDHDDELPPHALYEVAKAIGEHPEWKIIYSDEDKIDEKGRRFGPYFKPDWNYELLLSQNCVCHLGVYHAGLVAEVGGFRVGLEGSQDWDLALRCAERLEGRQIGHIPKVLYHWRAISGSTALAVDEKSYATRAGRRAVSEHLERIGTEAEVEVVHTGYLRVRRALPSPVPRVSLIIPTRDRVDLLRMCVQSILEKTEYPDYEVIIVDNQSSEQATLDYFASLSRVPNVRVLHYDAPFNYSAINNFAAAAATGDIIGLINNDIEVISPAWMAEMATQAARPEIGAVGALLLYPNDTVQHAGVYLGIGGVAGHAHVGLPVGMIDGRTGLAQEISAVTAACLFVRREVFEEVGGLDQKLEVAFNDVDFCLRVRAAGYRNLWTPFARLYHHESASRGYEDTPEKVARFRREEDFLKARWGESLLNDPAYNPNLSLDTGPFELAFPPRG